MIDQGREKRQRDYKLVRSIIKENKESLPFYYQAFSSISERPRSLPNLVVLAIKAFQELEKLKGRDYAAAKLVEVLSDG